MSRTIFETCEQLDGVSCGIHIDRDGDEFDVGTYWGYEERAITLSKEDALALAKAILAEVVE